MRRHHAANVSPSPIALKMKAFTLFLFFGLSPAFAAVSETPEEFHATGDFNGDGRLDSVIVDKPTGIYRIAFGQANETNLWVNGRPSGIENVTGFNLGRILSTARDALAFTSPSANRVNLFDASSTSQAGQPTNVFTTSLGPNRVVALDIGGAGNTAHADLFTPSLANNPVAPYRLTLTRSTGTTFSNMLDNALSARVVTTEAIKLKTNAANSVLAGVLRESSGAFSFVAQSLTGGSPTDVATINPLPAADAMVFANFSGTSLNQFLFYESGTPTLLLRPVLEPVPGTFTFAGGASFGFAAGLRQVIALPGPNDIRLLIIFGAGETASVYAFDGVNAPELLETFTAAPGDPFTGATATGNGNFTLLSGATGRSTNFQDWKRAGNSYTKGASGRLPAVNSLALSANVFLFANRPFVHPSPRLLSSLNAADWSSQLQTTNPAGQINVVAEHFVDASHGLDNPSSRNLGSAPAGAAFGLPNQVAESFSLLSFLPAIGQEVVEVSISPKPGHYPSGVSITFSKPDGVGALIFYRLNVDQSWQLYANQPIPLYQNTSVSYYALTGGNKSAIRTATYTFEVPPDKLDSDGDGVPDFVEVGLGGDDAALHSKDSDGDGYSDLAEILAGASGNPYNASIVPTNSPRADELSAFDLALFPMTPPGIVPGLLNCQTGTVVNAFDLHGGLLGVSPTVPYFNTPVSYFQNLFADVGQRLYIAATEPHFDVRTNNTSYPPGADTRVGRELLRLVPVPEQASGLRISYTNSGGNLAQETANWIAAAIAAQVAIVHPVLVSEFVPEDTLTALLFERKIGSLLLARSLIAPTNRITLFPFRPQDAGRLNPAHSNLLSLETNLVHNTGEPNPTFPGYRLLDTYHSLNLSVTSPPTVSAQKLRELAIEVYRLSALSNNVVPGQYPSPVDTLRQFLEGGTLHSNYLAATSLTLADLASAATGVAEALAGVPERPVQSFVLRVRADSFNGDCVILETMASAFTSLVLADGTPFKFPVAFDLIPGSLVEVWAYTDLPPTCGVPTLEVISLNVSAFPAVSSSDVNGNLLADAWENLFLLTDPYGDADNDGANNLKEFFDGTDPWNAGNVGGEDDATPPVVNIEQQQDGQLKFGWHWPTQYANKIKFNLVSADVLGEGYTTENVPIQDLGGGNFQVVLPDPGTSTKFFRLQMSLK